MKKITGIISAVTTAIAISLTITPANAVTDGPIAPSNTVADSVVKIGLAGANCTGVMISPSWALTAKHCVDDIPILSQIKVISPVQPGVHRDQGNYSATVHFNTNSDIALLNINGVHTGTVAQLPSKPTKIGDVGKFSGFGGDGKNIGTAQEANLALDDSYRANHYSDNPNDKALFLDFELHEIGGNLVRGDSGGPVFIGNELHGIYSGVSQTDNRSMNQIFASVPFVLDWIRETTGITGPSYFDIQQNTNNDGKWNDNWAPAEWDYNYSSPRIKDNGPSDNSGSQSSSELIGSSASIIGSSHGFLDSLLSSGSSSL